MQRLQAEQRVAMQVAEKLHREKLAAEREGEKEEEADPMAAAEAQALKHRVLKNWDTDLRTWATSVSICQIHASISSCKCCLFS